MRRITCESETEFEEAVKNPRPENTLTLLNALYAPQVCLPATSEGLDGQLLVEKMRKTYATPYTAGSAQERHDYLLAPRRRFAPVDVDQGARD
eukprot:56567-Eustigmatos_ZCMA.PRE.1